MGSASERKIAQYEAEISSLKDQIDDFEKLHDVLEAVSSSLEVDLVVQRMTEETLNLCSADQGSLMLFDPVGEQEAKTLIRREDVSEIKLDHFLNMLLAGWVSKHETPLLTNDLESTVGKQFYKPRYREITSTLSVPLVLRGDMIGALNLVRLGAQPDFTKREQRLVTILAPTFAQFIQNARLHKDVFAEAERLRNEVENKYAIHGIIGNSPKLQEIFSLLERVMPTDARVLLEGESGTGKELIARVIHYSGPRHNAPFVAVDCGALPANLLEGELFGYMKGAFTGAHRDKKGLFEEANGGTLFLDEIANMPLEIQSKFLRALQESEIRPLGSTKTIKVDVRVIAASGDLRLRLEEGNFRQDLYYRLNVVSINLPPLRERKGDIAILANHFLTKLADKYKKPLSGFHSETMAHFEQYEWPGNVRELENIVERMVILADPGAEKLEPDLLPLEIRPREYEKVVAQMSDDDGQNIKSKREAYEKMMLLEALTNNDWNQSSAGRELGISERTVRYKMQKFGIKRNKGGE